MREEQQEEADKYFTIVPKRAPVVRSEREWVSAAIKHRRGVLGLRQKDLADLVSAAGPRWTQQIVAKVETGARDVSFIELLAVCIALGTTPNGLLFPDDDPEPNGVAPGYVRFDSGKLLLGFAIDQLLAGTSLTGITASVLSPTHQWVDGDVVNLNEVLDLAGEYASDPDAVTVSEYMDETPDRVRQLIAEHSIALGSWVGSTRKRWTARELLDDRVWLWTQENPGVDSVSDNPKIRQVRTAKARELALLLASLSGEPPADAKDDPRG